VHASHERSSELRVLVVGVGVMGALHARTIRGSRVARLCGVVDVSEPVARAAAKQLEVPAFTDLARAIEEAHPDAAIIATPDPAHRAPAETLINAGVPLLIEKPLAMTVEDAQAIAHLSDERGVRFMTGHLTRFLPRYVKAVDTVRSGEVGKPVMVTTSTWGHRSLGARVGNTTNPLWHFAIHDIDTIQWITGGVIDQVDGAQLVTSSSGASAFAATGRLTTGSSFLLATGWTLPDTASPRWDLKIHCENGLVQATWSTDGLSVYGPTRAQEVDCTLWPTLYGQVEGILRREIDHFLSALLDDTPFLITTEEAVDAARSAVKLERAAVVRTLE
jgi:predicted dehydrogenase